MTITIPTREPIAQIAFPDNLPVEDGEPLETNWHRIQINLLVDLTNQLWYDRTDFFAGGNMFIYYSARPFLSIARPTKFPLGENDAAWMDELLKEKSARGK